MVKRRRRVRKKRGTSRPIPGATTPRIKVADGTPLFPDHLAKTLEIAARVKHLLERRGDNSATSAQGRNRCPSFKHPRFRISTFRPRLRTRWLTRLWVTDDIGIEDLAHCQDGDGNATFIAKEWINAVLDLLRREQVLDDLSEI
jgi:hypothetical protein